MSRLPTFVSKPFVFSFYFLHQLSNILFGFKYYLTYVLNSFPSCNPAFTTAHQMSKPRYAIISPTFPNQTSQFLLQASHDFFFFYFIFKLYKIVLVLPNIEMNPPQVYMRSPSWTLLPPPSPYQPSGSSQCTSPKHPVSCIEHGLATRSHDFWLPSFCWTHCYSASLKTQVLSLIQ